MSGIVSYFINIVSQIINILNRRFFPDMPITYLELILGCIIIKFIFKFVFGGFKSVETDKNDIVRGVSSRVKYSKNKNSDRERKKETIRQRGDKKKRS